MNYLLLKIYFLC